MPVYFGLPIYVDEAFRILGLDQNSIKEKIIEEKKEKRQRLNSYDNYFPDCYFYTYLDEFLAEKQLNDFDIRDFRSNNVRYGTSIIQAHITDKGQIILGYEITEVGDVWENILTVDKMIMILVELKTKYNNDIRKINADLSTVTIQGMESEPKVENFPEPYILEWGS